MSHILKNRKLLLTVTGAVVALILVGFSLWNQISEERELKETHEALLSELNAVENDIAKRQADLDDKKAEVVKETFGLDPAQVTSDASKAKEFFAPAFSWQSYDEYEKARQNYIASLGEGNSFTKTYLPPDTVIETNDGPLSYIDFEGIRATLEDIHVVPMTVEGDRIRYVAFVSYIMHRSDADLVNLNALEKSEAIVEFTAAGNKKEGERIITEVNARPGFQATPKP